MTLPHTQVRDLQKALQRLNQWVDPDDAEGPGEALAIVRRVLWAPLQMAVEEMDEVDRPGGRRRRRHR